jgi:hypothetical protein
MKRLIFIVVMIFTTMSPVLAFEANETLGCAFNFVGGPKVAGGEFKLFIAIIGVRIGLDIGIDSEVNFNGENTVSYTAEPSIGYFYCMMHNNGYSHIYASVGVRTFDSKSRDYYTSPKLYNSITARIGYARFFTDHIGVNAEIKADTYSICTGETMKTHRKFSDGITASIGVIFKM